MPAAVFLAIIESAAIIAAVGSTGAIILATTAYIATAAALSIGLSLVSNLLFAPKIPRAEDGAFPESQPIPPRQYGYGRARIGGFYMLYEVDSINNSRDVLALHEGYVDAFERFYLNTDQVTFEADGKTINGLPDGRYSTNHLQLEYRQGLPTETAYGDIVADMPGVWTSDHRGDGIASLALYCNSTSQNNFPKYYPNGLPKPSALMRLRRVWDFRLAGQSPTDQTTWTWSQNPILCLGHYLCFAPEGPGFDYRQRILPQLASWIAGASVCDEIVALNSGGNEPRYQLGGIYRSDNDPAEVIKNILDSCDGWIGEDGQGALKCYAGAFYQPSITVPADHIVGYNLARWVADEQAINQLGFTYTEPQNDYASVDGEDWIDEADQAARGRIRAQKADMSWVQSHSQGRRLAKRAVIRANAERQGTITTDLYGLQALGERYLNFVVPELPSLADGFVVEVRKVQLDLSKLQLTFTVVEMSSAVDEWNPATEEGNAPVIPQTVQAGLPPTPVNVTVAIDTSSASGVDQGVQLLVAFSPPLWTGMSFDVQYQVVGSDPNVWTEQHFTQDYNVSDASITLRTNYVALNQLYYVQVRGVGTRGTPSDWSPSIEVSTSANAIPPGAVTGLAVSPGAAGSAQATATWRNSTSTNFDHAIVYRAPQGSAFTLATPVSASIAGGLGAAESFTDTGVLAGAYSYWVAALNLSGASTLAGPSNVTLS